MALQDPILYPTTGVNLAGIPNADIATALNNPNLSAYTAPSSSTPIPAPQAASQTPLDLSKTMPTPGADQAGGIVAAAQEGGKSLQSYIDANTAPVTEADKQQQSILDSISALTATEGNKGADQAASETNAGIPGMQTNLQNLTNELTTATAAYDKKYANAEVGIGQTSSDVLGQQGAIRRAEAADIGIIHAKISAAQGNLDLAQKQVDRAIDLKYSTIEAQLATKKAQLDALMPTLNREERTLALAQQQKLDDQKQELADKKAEQKTNITTALTAGVQTNFVNENGKFFDARTGEVAKDIPTFLKMAGVNSITEAYQKGLVTDVNGSTLADRDFVAQARAKYPDVSIPANATPEQAAAAIKRSRIYQKETYIAPPAGSGSGPAADIGKLLQLGMQGDVPAALAPYQKISYNGTKFIDLSSLSSSDKVNYAYIATQLGLPVINNTADSSKLDHISDAKANLVNIQNSVNKIKLGSGAANPPFNQGINNSVQKFFGNKDLKAYNAWRTAIINNVQALAGGLGSGLRINQAEITAAMDNDLPVVTGPHADTPESAKAKLDILNEQLDTWEKQLLGGGNQAANNQTIPAGTDGGAYGYPGYVSDGKQWVPK